MSLFGPRRIGLALGSGSARGLAHIGVLKVLEAEGLRPDAIAGTSMGAVVGAFYAAGIPIDEIERIAIEFDTRSITGFGDMALGQGAVLSGVKAQDFLRQYLPPAFEDLALPFGCVALDLLTNRPVRFTSGDLVGALRASASVPLVFLPVRMDGMLLVDGYVAEPVPVSLARQLGGRAIVAVEVCGAGTVMLQDAPGTRGFVRDLHAAVRGTARRTRGTSGADISAAVSEAFERRVAESELRRAQVVISPEVHSVAGFDFGQAKAVIAEGERCARVALDEIRRTARR